MRDIKYNPELIKRDLIGLLLDLAELKSKADKYDKIKETIKKDIEDGNFVRHGVKKGGKDGSTYYKLTVKDYAQEILEEMEG